MNLNIKDIKHNNLVTKVVPYPCTREEIHIADKVAIDEYFNGSEWFTPTKLNVNDVYFVTRLVRRAGSYYALDELVAYLARVITQEVSLHHYLWISSTVLSGGTKSRIMAMGRTLMDIKKEGIYRIIPSEEWESRCDKHHNEIREMLDDDTMDETLADVLTGPGTCTIEELFNSI